MTMGDKMRIFGRIAAFAVAAFILSGCFGRLQPIYEVTDRPIPSAAKILSEAKMGDAIIAAGLKRRWEMERIGRGQIRATQRRQSHVAVVDIYYSNETYTLRYNSSEDLLYNGSQIHRTYNFWLRNLEADIASSLQMAAVTTN